MKKAIFAVLRIMALFLAIGCVSATEGKSPDASTGASVSGKEMAAITDSIQPVGSGTRTLVVYYSQGNATRRVAEDLALLFGADVERIVETKPRSSGFFDFMRSGYQSTFQIASPIVAPTLDPSLYGRVIVLTPVWSWHLSPPVRSWLRLMKGTLPTAAFVTVSGDTKPDKIVASMVKESGTTPLVFVGFGDKDFQPANRAVYVGKIKTIVDGLK